MYKIDNATAVVSEPTPGAVGPNPNGSFTVGGGITPSTIVDADWLNMVQDELAAPVIGAGLTPTKGLANNNQLFLAIKALIAQGAQRTFKNKLRNGAMEIDQANEGASVALATGTPQYVTDGWSVSYVSAATGVAAQRVADAPAGLKNSLKVTIGTGAGSVLAGDKLRLTQQIEGQELIELGFGNAGALPVSLQGAFKSSLTGTFSIALQNAAGNRTYVATEAVAVANTWTPWTLPNIPGDIAGSWATDNTPGLLLVITVACGSTGQTSTLNAWQASGAIAANTQTSTHLTTSGATFQATGVQIEQNSVVTPFEREPFTLRLQRCQREYNKSYSQGTVPGTANSNGLVSTVSVNAAGAGETLISIFFPVEMRVAPTMTYFSTAGTSGNWTGGAADIAAANLATPSTRIATVQNNAAIASNTQFKGHYVADGRPAAA
jgi:hypothetical protein